MKNTRFSYHHCRMTTQQGWRYFCEVYHDDETDEVVHCTDLESTEKKAFASARAWVRGQQRKARQKLPN
jgi:hypothetical protein